VDLNQLYFDHQISLMRADHARNNCVRNVHLDTAAISAQHIELYQRARNAPAHLGWEICYRSSDQPRPSERMPRIKTMQ